MSQGTALSGDAQFVTLGLGRELFAIPVDAVLEILDMRPIFHLPEAPAYLAGLIDVRGRAVPVIDLRTKLGLPSVEKTDATRILVLSVNIGGRDLVLGMIADRVLEVTGLDDGTMEPSPDIGQKWRSDYILGVGRRGDSFVVVFNLAKVFTAAEAAYLASAAAESVAAEAQ